MDDELTIRSILLKQYQDKNNSHIKYLYSIIVFVIGLVLSEKIDFIPETFKIEIWQYPIVVSPLFIYFLIRSRYWSAMVWAIIYVKPISRKFEDDKLKDNLFSQFNYACYNLLDKNNRSFLFIKLIWSNSYFFKFIFWISPFAIYWLFTKGG